MADEAGDYLAIIDKAEMTESSKKKSPQWTIHWTIMQKAVNGAWQVVQPYNRFSNWSIAGDAAQYTIKKMKAVGFNGDMETPAFSEDATVNGVVIRCSNINERGYGDWDIVDWGGGPSFDPASTSAKQTFKALWAGQNGPAKPAGRPAPPPPKAKPAAEPVAVAAEDVPF